MLILSILYTDPLCAQWQKTDVLDGKPQQIIPFKQINGLIIVQVTYNLHQKMNMLFDTGAQNIIFFKKSNFIIPPIIDKSVDLLGADMTQPIKAFISKNAILSTKAHKTFVLRDVLILEKDIMDISQMIGYQVDGILGNSFFRGLTVEIDYNKSRIILHDPNRFTKRYDPGGFVDFDIDISNNKPYFMSKLELNSGQLDSIKLLIDTGASVPLMIQSDLDERLNIPKHAAPGNFAKGLGGNITGYISKLSHFTFGKGFTIRSPILHIHNKDLSEYAITNYRDGLVGNPLLERFRVIIDYQNQKLHLKPNRNYNKEFSYDRSGISLIASGKSFDKYIVTDIIDGSPASHTELAVGDEIIAVGWRPRWLIKLPYITRKLSGDIGKEIKLTVRSSGVKKKIRFTLDDYFK